MVNKTHEYSGNRATVQPPTMAPSTAMGIMPSDSQKGAAWRKVATWVAGIVVMVILFYATIPCFPNGSTRRKRTGRKVISLAHHRGQV